MRGHFCRFQEIRDPSDDVRMHDYDLGTLRFLFL